MTALHILAGACSNLMQVGLFPKWYGIYKGGEVGGEMTENTLK